MQIDWFTLIAQLVNFLVLVWLLKRFLYKPILDAIDSREQRIAERLEEAANTQHEASAERDKLAASNADLEANRARLIQEAKDAANAKSQTLLQQARTEAEAVADKQQQDIQQQLQQLHAEIYQLTLTEVFSLSRKLLADMADTSLEKSLLAVFSAQLEAMAADSRTALIRAMTGAPAGALVRSAFVLDEVLQQQLQNTVNVWASAEIPLQFETSEALICGLELSAKGVQTTWNILAYLDALQRNLTEQLTAIASPEPAESAEHANA